MQEYGPDLNWIDTQYDDMVQQVIDWSHINTGSLNLEGLARMRRQLMTAFARLDAEVKEHALPAMEQVNTRGEVKQVELGHAIQVTKRPEAKLKVLLAGHMDTVFAVDHPFQTTSRPDPKILVGPGVADLKGGLVVILYTLLCFERSPYADKLGWEIVINSDEEIGSRGSRILLEAAARRNHLGLVYEPAWADGTLASERKGSGNFVAVVRGRSAHAGREPQLGRNAVVVLSRFIQSVDSLNRKDQSITVNVAKIEGGGAVNVVPDLALCRFNVRVVTQSDRDRLERDLQEISNTIRSKDGFSIELHGGFTRPPKLMTPQYATLCAMVDESAADLEITTRWQPTGGCCDGNNLAAVGLPNVDTMGVRGGKLHSDQEFLLLESLTERAKLSALLLMKLANGEFGAADQFTGGES